MLNINNLLNDVLVFSITKII